MCGRRLTREIDCRGLRALLDFGSMNDLPNGYRGFVGESLEDSSPTASEEKFRLRIQSHLKFGGIISNTLGDAPRNRTHEPRATGTLSRYDR